MAVLDHPVHERTRQNEDARYGCWNRPHNFRPVVHGADCFGTQIFPFRMSNECRFDLSETDAKCEGCQHVGSGAAYDRMVRTRGG